MEGNKGLKNKRSNERKAETKNKRRKQRRKWLKKEWQNKEKKERNGREKRKKETEERTNEQNKYSLFHVVTWHQADSGSRLSHFMLYTEFCFSRRYPSSFLQELVLAPLIQNNFQFNVSRTGYRSQHQCSSTQCYKLWEALMRLVGLMGETLVRFISC